MILLDAPYVSDILKQAISDLGQPVLDTPEARRLTQGSDIEFLDDIDFAARMGAGERVYANSENALQHIFRCGCNDDLARQIDICKDKARFRETIAPLHPDYRFMRAAPADMDTIDISAMPLPFIAKPARGFFSLGVHVVKDRAAWPSVVAAIRAERAAMNEHYPEAVVNADEFIIEQGIDGDEYAIDVYFDSDGTPVITNILYHHFLTEDDISDRLYYTSTAIIETWLAPFTDYVTQLGNICAFRDFAIHLEVRVTATGDIIPIEANPLRFAGWCVADITFHAWGINPYEHYLNNLRPDWPTILKGRKGDVSVMVIGDVPSSIDRDAITAIDYDGFCELFDEVMELRKIDYTRYPVFAFAFARMTEQSLPTLKSALVDDFSRYITAG